MFARKLHIEIIDDAGNPRPAPRKALDSFAMRNFTNDAVFDDTLPAADGQLEAGHHVPLDRLHAAMEDWLRRKQYLAQNESQRITEPRAGS
jgi:hypothetical protein